MKRSKRLIPLFLSAFIVFSGFNSFADNLTDVKGHWAEKYINDAISKKILSGYNDHTFKPEQPVSKLESIIMISNLYPAETVNSIFSEKGKNWAPKLREAKIPKWADPYVVFALEKKMFTATNLKNFIRQDVPGEKQFPAYRWEFVVLLTNGLELNNQLPSSTNLKYKDLDKIEINVRPYVQLMVDKKILNGTGNFDGKSTLKRSEAATIMSLVYSLSAKGQGTSATPTPSTPATPQPSAPASVPPSDGNAILGKLASMTISGNDLVVNFLDEKGVSSILTNQLDKVVFTKNNQKIEAKEIVDKNVNVQVTVDAADKRKVLRINVVEAPSPQPSASTEAIATIDGKFVSADAAALTVEVNGKAQSYSYDGKTLIAINGSPAGIVNIRTGDLITLKAQGTYIKSIESKGVNKILDGIVKQIAREKLTVLVGSSEESYPIQAGASVYKNGVKDTLDKVLPGDKISAQVVNSAVIAIDASTNKFEGKALLIKSITFSSYGDSQVVAEDSKGVKHNISISPDTLVNIDGRLGSLQDLKVGYEIDVKTENEAAKQIDAFRVTRTVTLSGTISKIEYNNINGKNAMVVALDKGGTATIIVTDQTQINNVSNSTLRNIDAMAVGDSVLVEGANTDAGMEAKRIVYTAK